MNVEEYSLKFSMLSKYFPSLVSNMRDDISHFFMGVSDLVIEEYRTTMLHDGITIATLMMHAKSIGESKIKRIKIKRGLRRVLKLKKNLGVLRSKLDKGGGSENRKFTCVTSGKRHVWECLKSTKSCDGFGK